MTSTPGTVDLEFGLHRQGTRYAVDLRVNQPDSDADVRPLRNLSPIAHFDLVRLSELSLDPDAYGLALGQMLLHDQDLAAAFAQCRSTAQALGLALRIRLMIAGDSNELQAIRWETLRDPRDGAQLGMGEQIYFVRHLQSSDWQPVRLRARSSLRALVVIANPDGLSKYNLSPIDLPTERNLAVGGLGNLSATVLTDTDHATLDTIVAHLRDGYDILYLVCHGGMKDGEPWLALEDDQGCIAIVSGTDLARRIGELAKRPRLALLISCQSGGNGASASHTALAPRLVEAGVPAVIAMQGVISFDTARDFVSTFCAELGRDGRIDRAASIARGVVRNRPDGWMPALYSRLISGRIWYVPGFSDARPGFDKWPTLIRSIREGRCTPIIGLGLLDPLIGSSREIAQHWADAYGFPLAPARREDLPQVAQFLAVNQDEPFVRGELRDTIRNVLIERFGAEAATQLGNPQTSLDEILRAAAKLQAGRTPVSLHRILAELPFPIYVNTCSDSLLADALAAAGRKPVVKVCPWNDQIASSQKAVEPTVDNPLVYHLFGHLADPDSQVLTEDDYFNYLIGFTRNHQRILKVVRWSLTETSLIFLGFRLEEWPFRVLFRSIMNPDTKNRRVRYTHAAVQIELDEHQAVQPDRARRYLEGYFGQADVSIYWGNTEDFLQELAERYKM